MQSNALVLQSSITTVLKMTSFLEIGMALQLEMDVQ